MVWRLRTIAVCTLLSGLAFLQAPGLILADSKTDLTENPLSWLARALHIWYPQGTFGQLQNQAYGYLWPIGPFFLVGDGIGVPPWVTQRLWWALLMCVAYTGVVALSGRLGIGTPAARMIAGIAFALSPRILSELGSISIEAWPSAVAPWVLVPLVGLLRGAPARPAITRSAIAVACAGGVNATAVLAVVPLALLFLATGRPVRRRWALTGAWCAAVAAATAWWVAPLLILGRYSPPFLDYIETAEVTTRITDLTTIVRGASHWLAFYQDVHGPGWTAGWALATQTLPVVATLTVAALGVAGLARRGMPHRRWLITGFLLGLALVGMGHVGAVDGTAAELQRQFLDGAGAPLRNVHKFDVVLRLPLILGLAHLLGVAQRSAATAGPNWHTRRKRAIGVTATALAAITLVASPALARELPSRGGYPDVPVYWHEAGAWLNEHLDRDRVLVVPAARSPQYLWGTPTDEITQSLLQRGWAVRDAIPLTPPATIRLLDAIESALATGAGSPGLAELLARSGVRYLLVRSDLNYGASGAARPAVVRQALDRSPGFRSVAEFGPVVGGNRLPGGFVDEGLDVPVRALEIFRVEHAVDQVVAYEATAVTTVVGGPESLLDLAAAGRLTPAPTILAGDRHPDLRSGPVAITDGLRRREVAFGLSHDGRSGTLTADELPRMGAPAADFLPAWGDDLASVVRYEGVRDITASSSWAQANPLAGSRPAHHPFAAFDSDPRTSWRSAPNSKPDEQWLEVEFDQPRTVSEVRVRFDLDTDARPTRVTARAGAESATVEVLDGVAEVRLPGVTATKRVTVSIDAAVVHGFENTALGIVELTIPGVAAERTLVLPTITDTGQPPSIVVTAAPDVASCFFFDSQPRCSQTAARASEDGDRIDRTLDLPAGGTYLPSLWVRPRPGPALDALLDETIAKAAPDAPAVTVSSTRLPHPATRSGVLLDGDPATAWLPAETDLSPWLRLTWPTPRTITGLRLAIHPDIAASPPGRVQVIGDGGTRSGPISDDGIVTFESPMTTDNLTVLIEAKALAHSYNPYSHRFQGLPIGVGEVSPLPGPANERLNPNHEITLPCGAGPGVMIDGVALDTAVTATLRDLIELREVRAQVCRRSADPIALTAGETRLVVVAGEVATPVRFALSPDRPAATPKVVPVRVESWSATQRRLHLDPHPVQRVLALRENTNPGWRAVLAGRELTPIVTDGWQQGWIVPVGAGGEVRISFTPDTPYRIALLVGAGLVVMVVLLAVLPQRRPSSRRSGAPDNQRYGWFVPALLGAVALLTVGGGTAVLLAALGIVGVIAHPTLAGHLVEVNRRQVRRVARQTQWWLPIGCFVLAGWQSLSSPDPHTAALPQLGALAMATALWLSVVLPARRRRSPHHSTGRSSA